MQAMVLIIYIFAGVLIWYSFNIWFKYLVRTAVKIYFYEKDRHINQKQDIINMTHEQKMQRLQQLEKEYTEIKQNLINNN